MPLPLNHPQSLVQGTIPLWAGCLIVSFTAFGLLLLERRGARWLEALFGLAIGILAVSMAVRCHQRRSLGYIIAGRCGWLRRCSGLPSPPRPSRVSPAPPCVQVNFFRAGVPAGDLFVGLFVPKLSSASLVPAIAALGALVMPYNL